MKNNISHTTFKTDEIEQSVDAASELPTKSLMPKNDLHANTDSDADPQA